METIILKHREFKEKLVKLINDIGLPAFMLKPTINELLEQLNQLEEAQYNEALEMQKAKDEEKDKKEE